jgi:hypothetical protein
MSPDWKLLPGEHEVLAVGTVAKYGTGKEYSAGPTSGPSEIGA